MEQIEELLGDLYFPGGHGPSGEGLIVGLFEGSLVGKREG